MSMPTAQTDGEIDGRTPSRYITFSAKKRGQRKNTN